MTENFSNHDLRRLIHALNAENQSLQRRLYYTAKDINVPYYNNEIKYNELLITKLNKMMTNDD